MGLRNNFIYFFFLLQMRILRPRKKRTVQITLWCVCSTRQDDSSVCTAMSCSFHQTPYIPEESSSSGRRRNFDEAVPYTFISVSQDLDIRRSRGRKQSKTKHPNTPGETEKQVMASGKRQKQHRKQCFTSVHG